MALGSTGEFVHVQQVRKRQEEGPDALEPQPQRSLNSQENQVEHFERQVHIISTHRSLGFLIAYLLSQTVNECPMLTPGSSIEHPASNNYIHSLWFPVVDSLPLTRLPLGFNAFPPHDHCGIPRTLPSMDGCILVYPIEVRRVQVALLIVPGSRLETGLGTRSSV